MAIDFKKFDEKVDLEGLVADVKEVESNGGTGDFKEVPHGTYEVEVNVMELTESKNHDPMVKIWFKILAGDFKGSLIFYNQVITRDFQIHLSNQLLRSMDTGIDVKFESYSQYADLLLDISEAVNKKLEFGLSYEANKKNSDFNDFKITDVFEVE